MKTEYIIIIIAFVVFVVLSIFTIYLMRKKEKKDLENNVNNLEIKKNNLNSLPILVELSKIEDIAKSEQLEEKVTEFKLRYEEVREVKLKMINDMIVDLDTIVEKKNVKEYYEKYSDIELMLEEANASLNNILDEVDEISSYEEKYRDIVTKLKTKYRFLENIYKEKETMFGDMKETIELQFENITKRFNDFDKVMEEKLYNEVVLVVKSIDTMIDNLDVIIREVPDILLLLNDLIPGRIKELNSEYKKMEDEGFGLSYLDYENNINNIEKRSSDILTRAKVLNITDSLFDSRAILEYLDGLFKELEIERDAKKKFDSLANSFVERKDRLEKIVKDIYAELDDIKAMYHLNEKDLEIIEELNLKLSGVIKEYKKLNREIKKKDSCFQKYNITINELLEKINQISGEFDNALRTLGSFYDDEKRAHTEYGEMQSLVKKCKNRLRNYSLPVIYDSYFVYEEEAIEAISEVEKEINNKPIVIKNLNMRVETARDLTLKLYKLTDDMIKYAYFTELLLVYSNKYRDKKEIDKSLSKVEDLYYDGEYKESYNLVLKTIKGFDGELYTKINKICKGEK